MTDYDAYKEVCKQAAVDDAAFNNFRSCPEYMGVLEHVSYEIGMQYIAHSYGVNNKKIDKSVVDILKRVDSFGGSSKKEFYGMGLISPTMLRYYSIYGDIERLHGSLDNKTVVEIGAGYGGQSMMLMLLNNIKKYIIVDLPEANALTRKFLTKNNMDMSKYEFYTHNTVPVIYSDYLISNYAFSECYKHIQNIYIDNLINKTKHFYIIANFLSDLVYSKEQLVEKLTGKIHIIPEAPSTTKAPSTTNTNLLFYK